ncbi:MAG: endonuclease/exonuclease/phosphatase family protein [Bryobacterales bacterium]|nr:endonuclease/exonuclease/phosphatase family protein [Bryobacterales bacterium]
MLTRRHFLTATTISVAAGLASAQEPNLTTISYNVLRFRGYPDTAGNAERLAAASSQMESRAAQELLLYKPDIVSFSESVTEQGAARIAQLLGYEHVWFAPGYTKRSQEYPIGFPGTILTKYRIIEAENAPFGDTPKDAALFTRHWGRAVLDTGHEKIAFFSGHLHPSDAAIREREVSVMLHVMKPALESGISVLLQGDLNHQPDGPEYSRWVKAGFVDALAQFGGPQQPTFNSIQPTIRIDYIWVAGPLAKRLKSSRVLFEGAFRTNPADPTSFALSDHVPVIATFG